MAVFTPIDKPTLEYFLNEYDLGKIINLMLFCMTLIILKKM